MQTAEAVRGDRMSARPIDGFRRNLETTLPELAKDVRAKLATAEGQVAELREDLGFLERVGAATQIDIGEKKRPGGDDASAEKAGLKVA